MDPNNRKQVEWGPLIAWLVLFIVIGVVWIRYVEGLSWLAPVVAPLLALGIVKAAAGRHP